MAEQPRRVVLGAGPVEFYEAGSGPPLLLLHGALTNARNWDRVVPILSRHRRCIVPTLPLGGHRLPMNASADLSPPGIADILRQFLDEIDVREANLVGNDTGGAYAQVFAAPHPDRVSKRALRIGARRRARAGLAAAEAREERGAVVPADERNAGNGVRRRAQPEALNLNAL